MIFKTIIVDDEPTASFRLKKILIKNTNLDIIATESDPELAIDLIVKHKPDLVFLDVEMPRLSGFDVLKIINDKGIKPLIVFTTVYDFYTIKAIKSQTNEYLLKPLSLDEVNNCVRRISNQANSQ